MIKVIPKAEVGGNAAVMLSDIAIACLNPPVFLRCGVVPVMEFGENIASLF